MTKVKNIPPTFGEVAFVCPFCNFGSTQRWWRLKERYEYGTRFHTSRCDHCEERLLWDEESESIIFPKDILSVPLPLTEMPEEAKAFYKEAGLVLQYSPRSACTLLRLSLEKLLPVIHSCNDGKSLKANIGVLKKEGKITNDIYRALEVVRVVGNHSVHDKEINVNDTPKIAEKLFLVINHIVDVEIKNKKEHEGFLQKIEGEAPELKNKVVTLPEAEKSSGKY